MNYVRIQDLFIWFPFLVTSLTPPYFISKPSKMELFLKCLHTPSFFKPHTLFGRWLCPEWKANNPVFR